jgi:hypothetical protein
MKDYRKQVIETGDGKCIAMRPIGDALFVVPFIAPATLVRHDPPNMDVMNFVGKIAGSTACLGAAIFFFLACRRLFPAGAWPATLLLALGTSVASTASQAIWGHGPAIFWLCLALYLLTSPKSLGRADGSQTPARDCPSIFFLAGICLGLAVMARSATALFALGSGLAFVVRGRWRDALGLTLGGMIPVVFLLWYNNEFFGDPIAGGYHDAGWKDRTPVWFGVAGFLVSPSRSIFVFSPALLLAPLGLRHLLGASSESVRAFRPLVLGWVAAAIATMLFFARWYCWSGGWCFGPRLLCETMPALCLLFACAYDSFRSRAARVFANILVGLSILVQIVGMYGHNEEAHWFGRHDPAGHQAFMFDLNDSQIEAYANNIYCKLAGKKRHAEDADRRLHFQDGNAIRTETRGQSLPALDPP